MEQTIGARIKELRKRRNMTQTQLAELLGVSAQAVSKWESDISCPDITLLPKLAEVFQVTTDSLLGLPEKAEIVSAPPKQSGFHVNLGEDEGEEDDETRGGFTFQFDITKSDLPWFATAVLLFAVGLLLNRTLLAPLGEAGIWDLLWPSAMLAMGLSNLWKKISLWSVGMTGFGGYYLLVNMHILNRWDGLSWKIILPVLLVLWALSMFADHFRKDRYKNRKQVRNNLTEDGSVRYDGIFCSDQITVSESIFYGGSFETIFGNLVIDLTNCETVDPENTLCGQIVFGAATLLLPRNWKVETISNKICSAITTHGTPNEDVDQVLYLNVQTVFSHLDIRW